MSRSFGLIFWGLFLTILDFRINDFDLLPDLVGYALVAIGSAGLVKASPGFRTSQVLGWILLLFEVVGYTMRRPDPVFSAASTILDIAMIWTLLGGVAEVATGWNRPDLARRASSRRIAYAAMGVALFLAPRAFDGSDAGGLLAMLLLVGMIVVLMLILHIIHRMKVESGRASGALSY